MVRRFLDLDPAHHPFLVRDRPMDEEFAALPRGADVRDARIMRAHELQPGDLVLADFPEDQSSLARVSDYFTDAFLADPAPYSGACECSECEQVSGARNAEARFIVIARAIPSEVDCEVVFRNTPLLVIPAASLRESAGEERIHHEGIDGPDELYSTLDQLARDARSDDGDQEGALVTVADADGSNGASLLVPADAIAHLRSLLAAN